MGPDGTSHGTVCHWERQAAVRCRRRGDWGGPGIDALGCLWTERKAGRWGREEQVCPAGKKQPPNLSQMTLGFCTQALEFQIGQAVSRWTGTLYVPVCADSWYHPVAPQNHDCSSVWPDSINSAPSSSVLRTVFPCNSSLARAAPCQLFISSSIDKEPTLRQEQCRTLVATAIMLSISWLLPYLLV